jgi:hypothetical protein
MKKKIIKQSVKYVLLKAKFFIVNKKKGFGINKKKLRIIKTNKNNI